MANEYIRKEWAGGVVKTTLNGAIAAGTTTIVLTDGSTFPAGTFPFVIVIDRGTATEEKVLVQTRTGNSLTVLQRGYDGASAQSHINGAYVEHVLDAYTVDQANAMSSEMTTAGDLIYKQTTGDNTAFARLGIGTSGQALVSTGSAPSWGQVGTAGVADASITAAKIAAAVAGDGLAGGAGAALSVSVDNSTIEIATDAIRVKNAGITAAKLAAVTAAQMLVADSVGAPTWRTLTGDVTVSDTGVTAISSGVIVAGDFNTTLARTYIVGDTTALAAVSGMREGDMAMVTADNHMRYYDGAAWKFLTPQRGSASITFTAAAKSATTVVNFPVAFAAAPVVLVTGPNHTSNTPIACAVHSVGTSSFTVIGETVGGASISATHTVYWTALEATV